MSDTACLVQGRHGCRCPQLRILSVGRLVAGSGTQGRLPGGELKNERKRRESGEKVDWAKEPVGPE